ncbi:MAG TPA: hypothetical protein PKC28_02915 [Bdellovibrionales bacterium]|nr:hypothetical protein [Bdellovibrionales bacterium]
MNTFTSNMTTHGNSAILELKGPLNEHAKLPEIKATSMLTIKLHSVTQLNSLGVREWCGWIKNLPDSLQISLEGCPLMFVKSFSLIKGVLTPNTTVMSMYVPFYSKKSREETDVLLQQGKHYSNKGILSLPEVKDSAGNPMELDSIAKKYLAFLFDPK